MQRIIIILEPGFAISTLRLLSMLEATVNPLSSSSM